jgi:predicted nucleic-acid-binding protein
MIAVDTNVLVRFLTRDDAPQADRAVRCMRHAEVLVLDTVLLETVWVLTSAYSFSRSEISVALRRLLGLPNVRVPTRPEWSQRSIGSKAASTSPMRSILLDATA